ncbi:MAG: hypothetical protein ACF8NJ_00340 [Phycisphaerales bacterium JB038]
MQFGQPRRYLRPLCAVDPRLERVVTVNGFQFPLGVIPAESVEPSEGYRQEFESGQAEWPDCYMFDVVVSAEKAEPLFRDLLRLAPSRLVPILDVRGDDAYREMDPYLGLEELDRETLTGLLTPARAFLFEDGHCGFGVVAEDPLFYVYLDDHKILTIRCGLTEAGEVEELLEAQGISAETEPLGVDAVAHDHLDVLWTDDNRRDLLDFYGMLDTLRQEWGLELNIDPESNVDDDGRSLDMTAWRVLLLLEAINDEPRWRGKASAPGVSMSKYAELLLTAESLARVDELVERVARELTGYRLLDLVTADRIRPEELSEALGEELEPTEPRVFSIELIEEPRS